VDHSLIKSLTDKQLVSEYRKTGEQSLAGELYLRYSYLVFGVCMKYLGNKDDSNDATIEIFEKLLHDLRIHEVENVKGWLYTVAKNHCLMKFRKEKQRIENHPELYEELSAVMEWEGSVHLDNGVSIHDDLQSLAEAITKLNKPQQLCIDLFYLQEKSYQEIMKLTGFEFGQVKTYIQNGKRNLKTILMSAYEKRSG
jgi:RNA polymerase sigma factor (sigma-70 family)